MRRCVDCDHLTEDTSCPKCGGRTEPDEADKMDQLVQSASIPNLASLFRKAKASGVIDAVSNYGEGAPAK